MLSTSSLPRATTCRTAGLGEAAGLDLHSPLGPSSGDIPQTEGPTSTRAGHSHFLSTCCIPATAHRDTVLPSPRGLGRSALGLEECGEEWHWPGACPRLCSAPCPSVRASWDRTRGQTWGPVAEGLSVRGAGRPHPESLEPAATGSGPRAPRHAGPGGPTCGGPTWGHRLVWSPVGTSRPRSTPRASHMHRWPRPRSPQGEQSR